MPEERSTVGIGEAVQGPAVLAHHEMGGEADDRAQPSGGEGARGGEHLDAEGAGAHHETVGADLLDGTLDERDHGSPNSGSKRAS